MKNNAKVLSRALATEIRTLYGQTIETKDTLWQIATPGGPKVLRFDTLPGAGNLLVQDLKLFLGGWLQRNHAGSAVSSLSIIRIFLAHISRLDKARVIDDICWADYDSFRSAHTQNRPGRVLSLHIALCAWINYGAVRIDLALRQELFTNPPQRTPSGEAVSTLCPEKGALSPAEESSLRAALHQGFKEGKIELEAYVIVLLNFLLGLRPCQIAALKCTDLLIATNREGKETFTLLVPRAKQGGPLRTKFTKRELSPRFGLLIRRLAYDATMKAAQKAERPDSAPLFRKAYSLKKKFPALPEFQSHASSDRIGSVLRNTIRRLSLASDATTNPLCVSSLRGRRTFATNMLRAGRRGEVIAQALDQNTSNVWRIYAEVTPEVVSRIGSAVQPLIGDRCKEEEALLSLQSSKGKTSDTRSQSIVLRTPKRTIRRQYQERLRLETRQK